MQGTEIRVEMYCYEADFTHKVYFYFNTKREFNECFLDLIERAKVSDSTNTIVLKVPKGAIENHRYFIKDYRDDRKYKIIIKSVKTEIKNAIFKFKNDECSSEITYNIHFIKDIELIFNENNCSQVD